MTPVQPFTGAGFAIPQVFPDGPVDVEVVRRIAQKADALGYQDLWAQEQIIGQSRCLEPLALLSYAAGITERLRLGVSILVLPHRNPVQLAKTLATLDVLSGGRLTVGVGLGAVAYDAAFGLPEGRRVRRFVEVLAVMDALWTQDAADYDGEFYRLEGTPMLPKPLQQPRPPVWFGARSEAALRRAVRLGDGWMGAGSSSTADFREQIGLVRRLLDEEGRDPATFGISKRVYVAIDDDRARAERRLERWFAHNYRSAEMAARVSIWGPADECCERIDEIIHAGAQHLLLNPVFDFDEHLDALSRYAGPSA
ncbi:MAG: TIGR03619 family F420-dependent LLM class oxidoreductase [Dehalococcoidia bacterium]